jgi:hypothetical protein
MNVEVETEAAQFLFWEYMFKFSVLGQCVVGLPFMCGRLKLYVQEVSYS